MYIVVTDDLVAASCEKLQACSKLWTEHSAS